MPPPAWETPAALEAAPLVAALQPIEAPVPFLDLVTTSAAGAPAGRGPWDAMAGAGTSVGVGVKNAGVATAGFFTRLGRSIAGTF